MVAFRTEDLFSVSFFFGDHLQREEIALPNFRLPKKTLFWLRAWTSQPHFFFNDVIFAMKSQAVRILHITLFLEIES